MFDHINSQDLIICITGILMFWLFRFSSDKDKEFDEKQEGKETKELFTAMVKYVKKWTAMVKYVLKRIEISIRKDHNSQQIFKRYSVIW